MALVPTVIEQTSRGERSYDIYSRLINSDEYKLKEPELMVFMIVELISSTCYSSILYSEPVSVEVLKPYLFDSIRDIVKRHTI